MKTFLVRVWTAGDGDELPEGIRGTAVHLSSGQSITYTEPERLIRFLVETDADATAAERSPDAILSQTPTADVFLPKTTVSEE